jgi:hypothetical protein
MSVATEVAPEVYIPERARPVQRGLRLVPLDAGRSAADSAAALGRPVVLGRGEASVIELADRRAAAGGRAAGGAGPAASPLDGQRATAPLRLTRRGVVALGLLTAALGGLLLLAAHLSAGGQSSSGAAQSADRAGYAAAGVVTVRPGDTLWSIAGRLAPRQDPRPVVDRLQRLNSLKGASLIAGQTLKVN